MTTEELAGRTLALETATDAVLTLFCLSSPVLIRQMEMHLADMAAANREKLKDCSRGSFDSAIERMQAVLVSMK